MYQLVSFTINSISVSSKKELKYCIELLYTISTSFRGFFYDASFLRCNVDDLTLLTARGSEFSGYSLARASETIPSSKSISISPPFSEISFKLFTKNCASSSLHSSSEDSSQSNHSISSRSASQSLRFQSFCYNRCPKLVTRNFSKLKNIGQLQSNFFKIFFISNFNVKTVYLLFEIMTYKNFYLIFTLCIRISTGATR